MKYRAVEILFQHKVMILLPLVVVVLATGAVAARPPAPTWQAFATVWVDPYTPTGPTDGTQTAINQAQLINDFIHTRNFAVSVLGQTRLAPMLNNPVSQLTALSLFQRWTHVAASGSFVTIVATTPDPDLSLSIDQSVLNGFQSILQGQSDSQVQATLSAYGQQLKTAQDLVTQDRDALASYLASHPQLVQGGTAASAAALDPTYAALQTQLNLDQQNYEAIQQRITSVQQSAVDGRVGLPFDLTLVDEPVRPVAPVRTSRLSRIKLPGIGLVVGLLLSGAVATLLILSNRKVLGEPDVRVHFDLPVLGEFRTVRSFWWPWQRKPAGVRRAWTPWSKGPRDGVRRRVAAAAGQGSRA